jgi:hypothetical protein
MNQKPEKKSCCAKLKNFLDGVRTRVKIKVRGSEEDEVRGRVLGICFKIR